MCKLNLMIAILFGIVICLNGYSGYVGKCHAVKNNTTGKLQCPDEKSIAIEMMGLANDNCSSKAFLNRLPLSLIHHITCTRSTCTLPFNNPNYNFLNIGFTCKECVPVKDNMEYILNCTQNHWIEIDNILIHSEICTPYDIFRAKSFQQNKIKSFMSERCKGKQTCVISNEYSNGTLSVYFHCEVAKNTTDNDTDSNFYTLDLGSNPRNHTPNYNIGNGNQTLDHDSGNRTHQTDQDYGSHTTDQYHSYKSNHTTNHDQSGNGNQTTIHQHSGIGNHTTNHDHSGNDEYHPLDHINESSNEQIIGGAIAGGVIVIFIVFLLIGVFMIRRCHNKRYQEPNAHSDKKMDNTRSNPMYDSNDLQEDQGINRQRTYSANSPHNTALYSIDTNYDHLQSKEDKRNNYTNGRNTNHTYQRDSSTYDHIQSKDGMKNKQTKTVESDVYSHLKGSAAVSDAIYDHTLHDGMRDDYEGDYDVSHGIMTDDDYDTSGNINQSRVEKSDSLYN